MGNASLKDQLQAAALAFSPAPSSRGPQRVQKSRAINRDTGRDKAAPAKPKWLDAVLYGLELLKAYFPLCFKSANETMPLKKGIKQDLVKQLSTLPAVVVEDKVCMIKALAYYVNTVAYHKKVVTGVERIDLHGISCGIVTAEEAQYSVKKYSPLAQAQQPSGNSLLQANAVARALARR